MFSLLLAVTTILPYNTELCVEIKEIIAESVEAGILTTKEGNQLIDRCYRNRTNNK